MPADDFNYFGWEGVSFLKPAAWDLSHVEGKSEKGYAVLDDGIKCRVQLRWQKAGKEADLEKAAARQKKILLKKDSSIRPELKDFKIRTFRGKKFSFESGGAETYYYMLQCRDCLQVLLLGVFGESGENIESVCGKMIGSLKDHAKGGKILWSVFGFSFEGPVELSLRSRQLHSGDLSFEFVEEKNSFFLHRVSLAEVFLRKKSLNRWATDFTEKKHVNVRIDNVFEDSEFYPGGVAVKGREMSRFNLIKKRFFNGYFWVSERSNTILGAAEYTAGAGSRMAELVAGVGGHQEN